MKIAIIGTCPSSRYLAPFGDPEWKIWNHGIEDSPFGVTTTLPRIDAHFELHTNMLWEEHRAAHVPYMNWLNNQSFELWMQDQRFFPKAKTFPKDELLAKFGPYFFTSTCAWMLAKAINDGAKEIGFFGVDMASDGERRQQRSAIHHLVWCASQIGVKVFTPPESDLLQPPPLYGYSDSTPRGRKLAARRREIDGHVKEMEAELKNLETNLAHMRGASEDLAYHENIWCGEPLIGETNADVHERKRRLHAVDNTG